MVFAVRFMIGVNVCVPLLISRNLRSSGSASPNVVPRIPVMVRSAVPVVLKYTVQLPPTTGYDCMLIIVMSASTPNSCSDNCGTFHSILSTVPFTSVSTNVTLNLWSCVTSTFEPFIIQYNLNCVLCRTKYSGMSVYDFTSV